MKPPKPHPRIKPFMNLKPSKGLCFVCDEIQLLRWFDLSIQKSVCRGCVMALIGADTYLGSTPGMTHPTGTVIP